MSNFERKKIAPWISYIRYHFWMTWSRWKKMRNTMSWSPCKTRVGPALGTQNSRSTRWTSRKKSGSPSVVAKRLQWPTLINISYLACTRHKTSTCVSGMTSELSRKEKRMAISIMNLWVRSKEWMRINSKTWLTLTLLFLYVVSVMFCCSSVSGKSRERWRHFGVKSINKVKSNE